MTADEKKGTVNKAKLDQIANEANKIPGLPVEIIIRQGNVYEEIKKVANEINLCL